MGAFTFSKTHCGFSILSPLHADHTKENSLNALNANLQIYAVQVSFSVVIHSGIIFCSYPFLFFCLFRHRDQNICSLHPMYRLSVTRAKMTAGRVCTGCTVSCCPSAPSLACSQDTWNSQSLNPGVVYFKRNIYYYQSLSSFYG